MIISVKKRTKRNPTELLLLSIISAYKIQYISTYRDTCIQIVPFIFFFILCSFSLPIGDIFF